MLLFFIESCIVQPTLSGAGGGPMTVYHTLLYCHSGPNLQLPPVSRVLTDDDDLVGEHDDHHHQAHQGHHSREDCSVNLWLIRVTIVVIFSIFSEDINHNKCNENSVSN